MDHESKLHIFSLYIQSVIPRCILYIFIIIYDVLYDQISFLVKYLKYLCKSIEDIWSYLLVAQTWQLSLEPTSACSWASSSHIPPYLHRPATNTSRFVLFWFFNKSVRLIFYSRDDAALPKCLLVCDIVSP